MQRWMLSAILVFAGSSLQAQTRYAFGFDLEGVECGETLKGFPGEKIQFDVYATLTQSDVPAGFGASGWSIGFAAEGADIHFLPGTAASGRTCGTGEMIIPIREYFCSATIVNPKRVPDSGPLKDQGPQGEGVVDGVALEINTHLEGEGPFKLLKVRAEAAFPAELSKTEEVRIYYQDGLQGVQGQGPGPWVENGIVHGCDPGPCKDFSLGECRFRLRSCPCPAGTQRGGDIDQDGALGLDDAIVLLAQLFRGGSQALPCGNAVTSPGNRTLFDSNGDEDIDLSDPIHDLTHLFLGGPPHALGSGCVDIPGCQTGPCRE